MKVNSAYKVQAPLALHHGHMTSLLLGYAPCFDPLVITTYLTLAAESTIKKTFALVNELTRQLNCTLDQLQNSLKLGEQFGLIDTYKQEKQDITYYVFVLAYPLELLAFLNHDVYGRYLIKQQGITYVELLQHELAYNQVDLSTFQRITTPLNDNVLEQWSDQHEQAFQQMNQPGTLPAQLTFDMKSFLRICEPLVFPLQARSERHLALIDYYGSLYQISVEAMRTLVGKVTEINTDHFDEERFKLLISHHYDVALSSDQFDYTQDSYLFLSAHQNGRPLGVRDRNTIAFLYEKYHFKQPVQNMLIEHILTTYKGSFTKALVQQVADAWVRAKVKTESDVKAHVQQSKSRSKKQQPTPTYMETPAKKDDPDKEADRQALLSRLKKERSS